jgi:hypothetical protein
MFDLGHLARIGELTGVINIILTFKTGTLIANTAFCLLTFDSAAFSITPTGDRIKTYVV